LAGDLNCECLSQIRYIRRIEHLAPFVGQARGDAFNTQEIYDYWRLNRKIDILGNIADSLYHHQSV
jgi:hypothetical protein